VLAAARRPDQVDDALYWELGAEILVPAFLNLTKFLSMAVVRAFVFV
jgi:hypothetical protein